MAKSQLDEIETLVRRTLQHVMDIKVRQMDIEMRIGRLEEQAKQHHGAMFDWCAPAELQAVMKLDLDVGMIDVPDDVADMMAQFTKAK